MGDRVAVLKDGVLQQCDTPIGLFSKPANLFVAGFIGSPAMNLVPARASGESAVVGGVAVPLTPAQRAGLTGEDLVLGVRPEAWQVSSSGEGLSAVVEVVEELGSDQYLYCVADGVVSEPIAVRTPGMSPWQRGERVSLVPVPAALHVFDKGTGARLPD